MTRPRCPRCDIQVPHSRRLSHLDSNICLEGTARKNDRDQDIANIGNQQFVFKANGADIELVDGFCYLGRDLVAGGTDNPAATKNLRKARSRWGQVSRVLAREGADPKTTGNFYKAVAQSVLLYGCETWVVSQPILQALNGFHNQVARRIAGCPIRLNEQTQEWIYPSSERALADSGLLPVEDYIKARHSTCLVKIQNDPMYLLTKNLVGGAGGNGRRYWGSQTFHAQF